MNQSDLNPRLKVHFLQNEKPACNRPPTFFELYFTQDVNKVTCRKCRKLLRIDENEKKEEIILQ